MLRVNPEGLNPIKILLDPYNIVTAQERLYQSLGTERDDVQVDLLPLSLEEQAEGLKWFRGHVGFRVSV